MQSDGLNSALSPVVHRDIAGMEISINTQQNTKIQYKKPRCRFN